MQPLAQAIQSVIDARRSDDATVTPLGAVIRAADHAVEAADELDARFSRGRTALAGLALTVKDCFDVAGMVTGHGVPADEYLATTDAPAVAALRAAGAIVIGKTNVPPYLNDFQSWSPTFPQTRNPWERNRTSGGSSSGAAAVAAGQSDLDLGSDMFGSIRLPAAWCGTYALRPSHGLVSKKGHLPWPPSLRLEPPASTVGVTARNARELYAPLDALLRGAWVDGPHSSIALPPAPDVSVRPLSFGLWLPDDWPLTGGPVRAAILEFVDRVISAGHQVRSNRPPRATARELALYKGLAQAEIAHGAGDRTSTGPLLALLEEQAAVVEAWEAELFPTVDAVLAPVTPIVAPFISNVPYAERTIAIDGRSYPASTMFDWCILTSIARGPSVVVPVGPDPQDGMPVGVQVLTGRGQDRAAIAIASRLQDDGVCPSGQR